MIRFWPLLFIAIPLSEIYLFIKIGGQIGALNTVLVVLITAVVGVNLLRYQGITTLRRAQLQMAQGQMPAQEMLEGLVLAVGGALLITPGFLTDFLGLLCLLPFTRRVLIRFWLTRASVQVYGQFQKGSAHDPSHDSGQSESGVRPSRDSGRTIEGEFHRDD